MKINIINERETEPTNVFLESAYPLQCGITAEVATPVWGISTRSYYKIVDLPVEVVITNYSADAGSVSVVCFGTDNQEREYFKVVEGKTVVFTDGGSSGGLPFDLPDVDSGILVPLGLVGALGVVAYFLWKEGAVFLH